MPSMNSTEGMESLLFFQDVEPFLEKRMVVLSTNSASETWKIETSKMNASSVEQAMEMIILLMMILSYV